MKNYKVTAHMQIDKSCIMGKCLRTFLLGRTRVERCMWIDCGSSPRAAVYLTMQFSVMQRPSMKNHQTNHPVHTYTSIESVSSVVVLLQRLGLHAFNMPAPGCKRHCQRACSCMY
eukprot:3994184-Amphidinium_carterae.1